jgi:hypothetical protein
LKRTCDGKDDSLVSVEGEPCACGLTFDDAERMVIWPHQLLLTREEKEQLRRLSEFVGRRGGEDVG